LSGEVVITVNSKEKRGPIKKRFVVQVFATVLESVERSRRKKIGYAALSESTRSSTLKGSRGGRPPSVDFSERLRGGIWGGIWGRLIISEGEVWGFSRKKKYIRETADN